MSRRAGEQERDVGREREILAQKAFAHSSKSARSTRERLAHKAFAHSSKCARSTRERYWLRKLLLTAQSAQEVQERDIGSESFCSQLKVRKKYKREILAQKAFAHSSKRARNAIERLAHST